jgi:hypothetical protein
MHGSGASRREIAELRLEVARPKLLRLFRFESRLCTSRWLFMDRDGARVRLE